MTAMLFAWLRQRRRQKLLAEPMPPAWLDILQQQFALFPYLDDEERHWLIGKVRVFLAEKEFERFQGFEITEPMRVLTAVQACLLTLGMPDYFHDNVDTVLLRPRDYYLDAEDPLAGEATIKGKNKVIGHVEHRGTVSVSWAAVENDLNNVGDGNNVIYHEFAHRLDLLNGELDGVPPLPRPLRKRWQRVMAKEYEQLCAAADRGEDTLIDVYGANEPDEFFAVVTEEFFDGPLELRDEHPDLYALVREYYRVEPAKWFERMPPDGD
jgi:Mlc titration factor MtfA (ptsG expression regulator)